MRIDEVLLLAEEIEDAIIEEEGSLTPDIPKGKESRRITRQFKRYGNSYERQYRCMSGPRKGRLVKDPQKCGKRKDPKQVRAGKKASRVRKGQRVRKTKLAKRRPNSQTVQRWNKRLRGQR